MTATILFIGAGVLIAAVLFVALGLPLLKEAAGSDGAKSRALRFAGIAFLALAPAVAALVYVKVGAPGHIGRAANVPRALDAAAIAAMPARERRAAIEGMVAGLAARLADAPNDAEGWRMLARSQMALERPEESAASYRHLVALGAATLDDRRSFVIALAASQPAGAFPTDPEFMAALAEIEQGAPGDPVALFYRGGAARQSGDPAGAAELWARLLASTPEDAPIRGALEKLIAEARADADVPK